MLGKPALMAVNAKLAASLRRTRRRAHESLANATPGIIMTDAALVKYILVGLLNRFVAIKIAA